MEITINLDLPGIIAQAVTAERLQPLVDKAIADAIKSAINDATGYRSAFSEAIKKQVADALPHGLKVDDLAKFQHVLNHALQSAVHGANAEAVNTALAKAVEQVIPDVPAVIKMSELMEVAREGFNRSEGEAFYALFEESEYGGGHLYLHSDPEPGHGYGAGGGKYACHYQLAFNKEGEVYTLKLRDKQVTPASRPDVITRFDAALMAMYVGRTRIDPDIDADEVSSAAGEQYHD
jgi:hypothetical protein